MLIFGNIGISWLEAWIIERRYSIPESKMLKPLLLANFGSAIAGFLILPGYLNLWEKFADVNAFFFMIPTLVLAWLVTLFLTIVSEWPIYRFALKRAESNLSPFRAALVANVVSYLALIALSIPITTYDGAFNLKPRTVPFKMSRKAPNAVVYFVQPDSKSIGKVTAQGEKTEPPIQLTKALPIDTFWDSLYVARTPTGGWRLMYGDSFRPSEETTIFKDFPVETIRVEALEERRDGWMSPAIAPYFMRYFGSKQQQEFRVVNAFWPSISFKVTNMRTGEKYKLGLESPFLQWYWRNQTVLPDGWCIAELNGKIYLLDLRTKEIALLAKGHGATVILGSPKSQQ